MSVRALVGNLLRASYTYANGTVLAQTHAVEMTRFRALAPRFQQVYSRFAQNDCSPYILDTWQAFNDRFVTLCQPSVPEDFFHRQVVLETLTFNPVKPLWKPFLRDLEIFFDAAIVERLLEETTLGNPRICERSYLTSPGRIVHGWLLGAYLRFLRSRGQSGDAIRTVVEFGGGYGGLANVWSRHASAPLTYVIFDTPIMAAIQWQYLSALKGEENVVPIFSPDQPLAPGRINLLPVSMLTRPDVKGDVFVSTWALSESNDRAQQAVMQANWFDSDHLMLAFQRSSKVFPYAEKLREVVASRGGVTEEMPYSFVNNFTAFA